MVTDVTEISHIRRRALQSEPLKVGDRCPDFFVSSIGGDTFELASFAQKKVWLAFYRYFGCPMCRTHLLEVQQSRALLEKGDIVFIAIFDCRAEYVPLKESQLKGKFFFAVGDENRNLFELFNVEKSWAKLLSVGTLASRIQAAVKGVHGKNLDGAVNRMPAHFLIAPGGTVAHAHYATHAGDHVRWTTIQKFAENKYQVTPANWIDEAPARLHLDDENSQTVLVASSAAPANEPQPDSLQPIFEVVYSWRVKLGSEPDFCRIWKQMQAAISKNYGGTLGAELSRNSNGDFTARGYWANESDWQRFWVTKEQVIEEVPLIRKFIQDSRPLQYRMITSGQRPSQLRKKES